MATFNSTLSTVSGHSSPDKTFDIVKENKNQYIVKLHYAVTVMCLCMVLCMGILSNGFCHRGYCPGGY